MSASATPRRTPKEYHFLLVALEPFAKLAHEHDFNKRADDDVVEVPFKLLKQAWIAFAKVAGSET